MVSRIQDQIGIREFEAIVTVLKTHSTTIKPGYEPVLHCNCVRQAATIIDIKDIQTSKTNKHDDKILRNGDKACIKFRFKLRTRIH